jgi:hypothetical protein
MPKQRGEHRLTFSPLLFFRFAAIPNGPRNPPKQPTIEKFALKPR